MVQRVWKDERQRLSGVTASSPQWRSSRLRPWIEQRWWAASRSARLKTSTKADGGWAPETAYLRFTDEAGTPFDAKPAGKTSDCHDFLASPSSLARKALGLNAVDAGTDGAVDQHAHVAGVEALSK